MVLTREKVNRVDVPNYRKMKSWKGLRMLGFYIQTDWKYMK